MKILKQSVGIDVSKGDFKICIGQIKENLDQVFIYSHTYENSVKGCKSFLSYLNNNINHELNTIIVMEATGVYHEMLANLCFEKKYSISILLPNKAKSFMKSINQRVKTDKIDAKCLCQMGLERNLDNWQPADPIYVELRALTRERENLVKEKSILKNKSHALDAAYFNANGSKKRLNKRIRMIEKQINDVEIEIKELIKSNHNLSTKVKNINKIKGLSIIAIATVIAETNGFNLIRNQKQLIGYAGLDVTVNQSGTSNKKGRLSKKGNVHIRRMLFMPALCAVQNNELLKMYYEQLNERQAVKKQGVIVVAKKLLVLIYALWKNETEYNPQINIKNNLELITV